VLARADDVAGSVTWARRLGGSTPGPLLAFSGERLFGGFDRSDGTTTWVTSDGTRLCFGEAAEPAERRCVETSASAIVPVGDRLVLVEVSAKRAPDAGGARSPRAAPKPPSKNPKPASHKGKGPAKGTKKPGHPGPARRPSHPLVEVSLRWVEASGLPASDASPTGLHFEAPLDGMTLADARARPPGIDLIWYETAPNRKTRSGLGSGRLMAGSLRADGTLDFASRVPVWDAEVEFGQLKDHRAPRLVGGSVGSTLATRVPASRVIALDAKGHCEAVSVLPKLARVDVDATTCAIAPDRLGSEHADERAALARILAEEPRRVFGQPRRDVGLVAWAGPLGWFLQGAELRGTSLSDGASQPLPHPFPAKRASIAWGAIAADGDGVALVDGAVVRVDAAGSVTREPAAATARVAADAVPADRRRAARIGATWWTARGPRQRLAPGADATPVASGHPDAQVLVGGAERGLSLEVASGVLQVSIVDAAGAATLATTPPAPVRVGFDAAERAAGGALVAGVSPKQPAEVVAFSVDAAGRPGAVHVIPLPFLAGDLAVRVLPLPKGGALVTELGRHHVVWIDDDGRPLGAAPWPAFESRATCPFGRPMRLEVPGPTPQQFVQVPDVGDNACIVGDAVWARDGSLRWFGGTSEGLDFTPELAAPVILAPTPLVAAPLAPAAGTLQAAPPIAVTAPARPCPPDMVHVGGKLCVDRFEDIVVDAATSLPLSPDYPTTPNLLDAVLSEWATGRERIGNVHARAFPLPLLDPSRVGAKPSPLAVSRLGARPNGYVTGVVAAAACEAAGKRLCTLDEFVLACRGEADTPFPYGDTYEDGVCNVFRDEHPAALLHGNASVGHLDPRLDRVTSHGAPLLRRTGESRACRSAWGDDAIYDMVGNLDEWVDEGGGAFAGGFFSRSTRSGCDAVVTNHPRTYLDYSTGVRCCRDTLGGAAR
jgi:hypothetical protein